MGIGPYLHSKFKGLDLTYKVNLKNLTKTLKMLKKNEYMYLLHLITVSFKKVKISLIIQVFAD